MEKHFYYKLYKPPGYLSQFVNHQNRRKNKKLLGEFYDFHPNTMAIGRLDENSEGLLLLTTDGKLSYKILNGGFEKEYYVQLDGEITDDVLSHLEEGVPISTNGNIYKTKPCKVKRLSHPNLPEAQRPIKTSGNNKTSWISITLTEGKYRQVRKMTSTLGFPTLRLVRVRVGRETIQGMSVGEVVEKERFLL